MKTNITDRFVDSLYRLKEKPIPDSVLYQAKRCLLDYLGAAFAGVHVLGDKGQRLLKGHELSQGGVTAVGFGIKVSVEYAALMNGLTAHVAEFDDGVRFGMVHPGAPVFSALLPVAEKEGVDGAALLKGAVTGYEATVRLASSIQPSHYIRGYHPTGTCGTIGAALGIAAMLGFSPQQMKTSLSAAAVAASGTLKVLENHSDLKPFNAGRAAVDGVMACTLATAGFSGPEDALSGNSGFLEMMTDEYDTSKLFPACDEPFGIEKVYIKPYASCRHTHPAIEAAIRIRTKHNLSIAEIKAVRVRTYSSVLGKHDHKEIAGASSAKMSIPFCTALALVKGRVGLEEFSDEPLNDPLLYDLTRKIDVVGEDEFSRQVPEKRMAALDIELHNGGCFSERVDFPKGEPETPLSEEELIEKFTMLAQYGGCSAHRIQGIKDAVFGIEEQLSGLYKLL